MKRIINCIVFGKSFIVIALSLFVLDLPAQTENENPLPHFLFPKFTRSIVKMKAGNQYSASINYNMIDEEMIFEQKGGYLALDRPSLIDTVLLQNRTFVPVERAFYEVVVKGPLAFFIQHKSRYAPVGSNTAYGLKSQTLGPTAVRTVQAGNQVRQLDVPTDVTVAPATVFWVRKNNEMEKFTTERQLLKIFPEKETELKEFIKKEKLDLKIREDLIRIGNYCNELYK
jgi:hypothetical protein